MEIQFWVRVRSGFLSLVLIGNSVLGSCGVGLFVPDFDWKCDAVKASAVEKSTREGVFSVY